MDGRERPLTYGWLYGRVRDWGQAEHVSHLTPHRLRHTFATRLINAGVPITSLQKLLGHDHLSTTQIYARVYDTTVERDYRQAMERLQGANAIALPAEWFQRPVPVPLPVANCIEQDLTTRYNRLRTGKSALDSFRQPARFSLFRLRTVPMRFTTLADCPSKSTILYCLQRRQRWADSLTWQGQRVNPQRLQIS